MSDDDDQIGHAPVVLFSVPVYTIRFEKFSFSCKCLFVVSVLVCPFVYMLTMQTKLYRSVKT
jgi:hypothetical protein